MHASHNKLFSRAGLSVAILLCASLVFAQEDEVEVELEDETTEEIEEIIVYARPGEKIDMDARYAELFRSRASIELARLEVLDDEYEWRKSMSENQSESRIKWGYDPEAEQAMRRDAELSNVPVDTYGKPATLFRATF
jgi:hypothetical protein